MTQTSSAIIAVIKPSMEYVKLCMSMRFGQRPRFRRSVPACRPPLIGAVLVTFEARANCGCDGDLG